ELNEDPNGEQSGWGTQKPRESCAGQGVSEKGKEKAVDRESSAVQKDKERVVERESPATVDKGKSKEESADSLDSNFADPNFSCDDNDDD
ncbi:Hypothetical predicted protein, partial [Prunus dulcis]